MTAAQKVIKYLAIAFAIFLIINIVSVTLYGLFALSGILGLSDNESEEVLVGETIQLDENKIEVLDIEVLYTNLKIVTGEELKVETDNKGSISFKQEGNRMYIEEKQRTWFSNNEEGDMIIYIPEDIELYKVKISTGAGKIDIETLVTQELALELGAGETVINNIKASQKCEIDSGAGKVSINYGTINNLELDMGVGAIELTASLTGKNQINAGIGNLNINLQGNKEDYRIKPEKGIGVIRIDGNQAPNSDTYGNGDNYIEIDGGIGNIDIEFEESV